MSCVSSDESTPQGAPIESTQVLVERARGGDARARDRLVERYHAALRRFGHGRLPARARSLLDTTDVVQDTLIRALAHLDDFEVRRTGAFFAYLKQALVNRVRDEARAIARRPDWVEVDDDLATKMPGPVEELLGRETYDLYERSLAALPAEQAEAVQLRLEGGCSFEQIAEAVGSPSANAARMMVSRALARLATAMQELRGGS